MERKAKKVKSFRITYNNERKLKLFCKENNITMTDVINDLIDLYVPEDMNYLDNLLQELSEVTEDKHLDLRRKSSEVYD